MSPVLISHQTQTHGKLVRMADVIVIGAGLSGLRCAGLLIERGLEVVVVEASDGVGGRVRTDAVDGWLGVEAAVGSVVVVKSPGFVGGFCVCEDGAMPSNRSYSAEVCERAVRL